LAKRFPALSRWSAGEKKPTIKQLEQFAKATDTSVGYLLRSEPPEDRLPVPDFRTLPSTRAARPSPNLLDTIFLCQQRQDWYRSYLLNHGGEELEFVGSTTTAEEPAVTAKDIRDALQFQVADRAGLGSWSEALRDFAERAEDAGVLVMISGVVGSNTRRKLDPEEFRGFALVDDIASVVFVNGADTKAAQIFTLAHELAHIWLGQPAVSNIGLQTKTADGTERWCNAVAAELLVPMDSFQTEFKQDADLGEELQRLARTYKVSTLVVLRRVLDAGLIAWPDYQAAFERQLEMMAETGGASGGNFYNTTPVRTSKTFARAIVVDTLEGGTLHRDAFHLLGVRKYETFKDLGEHLGVA
jgi:Zn-dependent peptidase ImmA (M78 family)/transcriptional regulator with XRE-family HTH domain